MSKHQKQLKAKYFLDPVLLPFSIPKFPDVLNFKNFKQHKCDGWKILFLLLNIFVKLREREGQRVDLGRSLKGHL